VEEHALFDIMADQIICSQMCVDEFGGKINFLIILTYLVKTHYLHNISYDILSHGDKSSRCTSHGGFVLGWLERDLSPNIPVVQLYSQGVKI
jgi:hypothetical protein